jgi:hypothetical protein
MYRPNFCCECGKKILRLRWNLWTSSRFCDPCAQGNIKERIKRPAVVAILLLSVGFITGNARRPAPPPLIIHRAAGSLPKGAANEATASSNELVEDDVYICGARTKKGTPCSRRVHGNVRCWQHKGMSAMLPPEKLVVKG